MEFMQIASGSPELRRAEHGSDDDSSLVVALCYERYLQMHGMLAVLAELRGDDPEDAVASIRPRQDSSP
jgi:hypothetical protein